MKTSRFSDSQIIAVLKQAEGGSPVPELCREHSISSATFYKWRSKFGGMDAFIKHTARADGQAAEGPRNLETFHSSSSLRCPNNFSAFVLCTKMGYGEAVGVKKRGCVMADSAILFDRRLFPDRRLLDEGPPPGIQERRIQAERRGLHVEELDSDGNIGSGRLGNPAPS
jgi:putative transposase